MTLLPIVERELRVAARRRTTYWARAAMAFVATLVGVVTFVESQIAPGVKFGQLLFWGIAGMSMAYCLFAGRRMTADSLSEEKREGTFGLLFLTDLKGYDVVLGKLAARSFNGFYGLMAAVPILAIPLILGGVSWGEFWRMVIVLVAAFLLSLSIGIFASSISRHFHEAMGRNFAMALLIMALPPACAASLLAWHPNRPLFAPLMFSCPVYTFALCPDSNYGANAVNYWFSIATILFLTILLVALACRFAPRSWQDKPSAARPKTAPVRKEWRWWREGKKRDATRKKLLDQNAYYWLASRPYVKPAWVWTLLGLTALWLARTAMEVGRLEATACLGGALLLNSTLKLWIALESAQQLAADRKSGAFELLLSTPLTVSDIVGGQIAALRRQFLKPLIVVIAFELFCASQVIFPAFRIGTSASASQLAWTWTAGIVMLVADVMALSVTGMAAGISAKNYTQASMRAVRQILVLPWALYGLLIASLDISIERRPDWTSWLSWQFQVPVWFCIGIGCDAFFAWDAWRTLRERFRELAMRDSSVVREGFFAGLLKRVRAVWTAIWNWSTEKPANLSRKGFAARIAIIACGLLICVWIFTGVKRSFFPSAPILRLGPPATTMRIVSATHGLLFVMPDGSLWRWGSVDGISGRALTAERIGTNSDWSDAFSGHGVLSALRRDGALLEWNANRQTFEEPPQLKSGQHWEQISRGFNFSVGIKHDGSAWAWGTNDSGQLGNWEKTSAVFTTKPFPGRVYTFHGTVGSNLSGVFKAPVKVDSDVKWKAVRCFGSSALGISEDGRLWAWGSIFIASAPPGNQEIFGFPVQICAETNWVGFEEGWPALVRNSSNEVWNVFWLSRPPSNTAAASSRLFKIGFFSPSDRPAFVGEKNVPICYEVRRDGTLWRMPMAWWQGGVAPAEPARQVGKRRDWVSVWSNAQTVVGQTADGTFWFWGADLGHNAREHYTSKLQSWTQRLAAGFSSPSPAVAVSYTGYDTIPEPTPLFKITQAETKPLQK
jgi:hypothetical protein